MGVVMAVGAKVGMKLMTVVIGIPVGIATKQLVERTWHVAWPDDPPRKPSDQNVRLADAIGWAVLSGIGIVVADLVTRRTAEVAFQAITGNPPPPTKPSKAAKKHEQAAHKSPATAD